MADRTTKHLLLAIALGLWANVVTSWLTPTPTHAQDAVDISRMLRTLSDIDSSLDNLEDDVDDIEDGTCSNSKIC